MWTYRKLVFHELIHTRREPIALLLNPKELLLPADRLLTRRVFETETLLFPLFCLMAKLRDRV
jgi:hypothetical protein